MFSKNNEANKTNSTTPDISKKTYSSKPLSGQIPSILGHDLVITGDIIAEGEVQIEGRVEGNIKATSLTIGEQGSVNGTIKAGTVVVRGKVSGKITASRVEMLDTANVTADVVQDSLTIANGAFFDGKCSRKTKPVGTTSTATTKGAKR
jgi:cytoskeletal protein CcmA (bactofilin family)